MSVIRKIQKRRDTAANWTSANPTLANGEEGYETDTRKSKIGNGSAAWNSLPYVLGFNSAFHPSSPGATLPTTANYPGELFVKTGVSIGKRGVYSALDLVGNWTGPLAK